MTKPGKQLTLLLTLEYPPQLGGIATYLSHLAERFPAGSLQVMAPPHPESKQDSVLRRTLLTRWLRPRWLPALYHTWRFWRQQRPAVLVVSHLLNMGRVAFLMHRFFGLPYVVILHGMDIALASTGGQRQRRAARRILANAGQVVCNSQYTARWVTALGIQTEITIVNPPPALPLDTAVDQRRADELRARLDLGESFVLLSTGRLVERKGFDICLEALAGLVRTGRDIKYVIVGQGPERQRLEQLAQELGLQDRVHFLGTATTSELTVAYSACDAFVMVPRALGGDVEGFGIVYLEAGLFGKPVIGSRSGGVPEAVLHERTGLLVEPTDVGELRMAIERLMDDEALRVQLVQGARMRLQQDYGDERQARQFMAAVRRAAQNKV